MANNETETRQQSVHIVLQEKGGIGKSFIANILLQYLTDGGAPVVGIDTDPSNASLACYKSLNVKQLDIMDDKRIDIQRFDDFMMLLEDTKEDYVVDIGSSNFIGFHEYVTSQDIFSLIESMGIKVYLHIIVVGGEVMGPTLTGLEKIVAAGVTDKSVVIWENEHFGKLYLDGSIMESEAIQKLEDKIFGGIVLDKSNNDLHGRDLQKMQKEHCIFADINDSKLFLMMEKIRLHQYKVRLWDSLDTVFSPDTPTIKDVPTKDVKHPEEVSVE